MVYNLKFANRAKKAILDGRYLSTNKRTKYRHGGKSLKRSASMDYVTLSKAYEKEKKLRENL